MNTIRDNFYRDLILEYTNEGEQSFLYRYFWADSVSGLLEEHFPGLSLRRIPRPKDGRRIREKLARVLEKNPGRAADKLLKKTSKGNRRNFWEELWLNDAGYLAGLVENRDYYLWLVEYLEARDIYYKDTSMWDQRDCLGTLLQAGLRDEKKTFEPGCRERKSDTKKGTEGESLFTTAQLKRDLADLAEKLRREHEAGGTEISDRLRGLKRRVGTKKGEKPADYLLWLTSRLERMALHIRIKTWLQDSGYPLGRKDKSENPPREPRKQDFSLRLFEAYCDSGEGYEFYRKDLGGQENSGDWHTDSQGFCMLELSQADGLREILEQSGGRYLYIPLAIHLGSGCIFFLAGKENYREAYEKAGRLLKEAYRQTNGCCCFDYLRLDEGYQAQFPGDVGGAFRLQPAFHENQGRSCLDVFMDFKRYCLSGTCSPRRTVKNFNEEAPDGIPDAFRWAFDNLEEMEVSPQAAVSFQRVREMAERSY